jgi:uncharacterized protein YdaU (DUF1376 family)
MHYYQFNIGDYASHTSRLSPMEDLAYRRLLDLYYLNEHPLNGCATDVAREIGLVEHVKAVEYVLSKFFTFENDCYKQKRIDFEIKKYKSNARNKSKAGKASAKARQAKAKNEVTDVEQVLNTNSTGEQLNINQEPLTKNQEPVIKDPIVSAKPKQNFSDGDMAFVNGMLNLLIQSNPKFKQPNKDTWANTVRLMRERDDLTHEEMASVFTWANNDEFWSSNILSPSKLRDKWNTLLAQSSSKQKPKSKTSNNADNIQEWLDS